MHYEPASTWMYVHNIIKFMYSNFSYGRLTFICHDIITRVDLCMFQFKYSFRITMVKVLLSQRVAMIMLLLLGY